MFFNGSAFWFVMGVVFVVVVMAFRAFARDRGWRVSWWKGLLAALWYATFSLSFYAWGTLVGEGEAAAGVKLFALGMFFCVVLGAGLLRLLSHGAEGR